MRGAGGTEGGIGQFLIGFLMMCAGFYLLLSNINVNSAWGNGSFNMGTSLYRIGGRSGSGFGHGLGGFHINSGMILVPFIFGIGIVFYNSRNIAGWLLSVGSIFALIVGIIASLKFNFNRMTGFELTAMIVLAFGGTGLFLRSLKSKAPYDARNIMENSSPSQDDLP